MGGGHTSTYVTYRCWSAGLTMSPIRPNVKDMSTHENGTAEAWRTIVDPDGEKTGYEVSSLGRVRSLHPGHVGKIVKGGEGPASRTLTRRSVWLARPHSNKRWRPSIDTLVAAAFLGEEPDMARLVHKNGCVWDDRADNLAWESHADVSSVLTPLVTPQEGDAQAAKLAKDKAWVDVRMAQDALQRATERAIRATETWAHLDALSKAQNGPVGFGEL